MKYDYLIVGAGLFGAVFAREAVRRGKKVLVLNAGIYRRATSIPKRQKRSRCTSTAPTFSTLLIRKSGST